MNKEVIIIHEEEFYLGELSDYQDLPIILIKDSEWPGDSIVLACELANYIIIEDVLNHREDMYYYCSPLTGDEVITFNDYNGEVFEFTIGRSWNGPVEELYLERSYNKRLTINVTRSICELVENIILISNFNLNKPE